MLSRRVRMKELTRRDAVRVSQQLQSDLASGVYERLNIEAEAYVAARGYLARFDLPLRSLDAIHLAVAASAGATLMTADAALAKSAGVVGVGAVLLRGK